MKDEDYRRFFDSVVSAVAEKVMESSIVAHEVARLVGQRQDVVDTIVNQIDPAKVAEHIARNMNYIMHTGRKNNVTTHDATSTYTKIMADAKEIATKEIAKQMTEEVMGV